MPQSSRPGDVRMRGFARRTTVADALNWLDGQTGRLAEETVPLAEAAGRVLSQEVISHGDKDPLVPHNQSVRLTEALRKAGADVTLITVKGGGHGGFRSEELTRRVHRFFDKHLRGRDVEISAEAIPQGQGNRPRR